MHTVDNAAVRESFASEIYEMGVQKASRRFLVRFDSIVPCRSFSCTIPPASLLW